MGFPASAKAIALHRQEVSIPSRGLWVFPQILEAIGPDEFLVSIPSRGLWVFPPSELYFMPVISELFQSLVGVYGFSRYLITAGFLLVSIVSIPSRGLWVFPPNQTKVSFSKGCNKSFNP